MCQKNRDCLSQGKIDALSQKMSYFGHCVERDGRVIGIEQAINTRSAGFEALRHFSLGDFLLIHSLFELMSELELDCGCPAFFENSVGFEKIVEIRTQMFFLHKAAYFN